MGTLCPIFACCSGAISPMESKPMGCGCEFGCLCNSFGVFSFCYSPARVEGGCINGICPYVSGSLAYTGDCRSADFSTQGFALLQIKFKLGHYVKTACVDTQVPV